MPDDVTTQGQQQSGTLATQGDTTGKVGSGAPNDAPPAEELFTQSRVKAIAAKEAAEEAMRNRTSDMDYAKAQAELSEALAQIQAIERLRKTTH